MTAPAPARTAFAAFMDFVFLREGGWVDHPADPGGATNHGISLRFAVGLGRLLDMDGDGDVDRDDIRMITREVAAGIYRDEFWRLVRADELPPAVAIATTDAAVNCGPARAVRWLQGAVGARADGQIGPRTLASVAAASPRQVLEEIVARRMMHHATLPTFRTFGLGWMRRCAGLAIVSAEYLPPLPAPAPEPA